MRKELRVLKNHSDAALVRIWTSNASGQVLELEASAGSSTVSDGPHTRIPVGQFSIGLAAKQRRPYVTNDLTSEPWSSDPEWLKVPNMAAFAGYPLIAGERLKGVLAVFSRRVLTDDAVTGLSTIADAVAMIAKAGSA